MRAAGINKHMSGYLSLLKQVAQQREGPILAELEKGASIVEPMIRKRNLPVVVVTDAPFMDIPGEVETASTGDSTSPVEQWYADSVRYLLAQFLERGEVFRWVKNMPPIWDGPAVNALRVGFFDVVGAGRSTLYFVKYVEDGETTYGFRTYDRDLVAGREEVDASSIAMLSMLSTIADMRKFASWPRFGVRDLVFAASTGDALKEKVRMEIVRGNPIYWDFQEVRGVADNRAPWASVLGWSYELDPVMRHYIIGNEEFYLAKMANWPVFVITKPSPSWIVKKFYRGEGSQEQETDRSVFRLSDADVVDVSIENGEYRLGIIRGDGVEHTRMSLSEFKEKTGMSTKDSATKDDSESSEDEAEDDAEPDSEQKDKFAMPPGGASELSEISAEIQARFDAAEASFFNWPVGSPATWSQSYINRARKVLEERIRTNERVLYLSSMLGLDQTEYDRYCMLVQKDDDGWIYLAKKTNPPGFQVIISQTEPTESSKVIPPLSPVISTDQTTGEAIDKWMQDASINFRTVVVIEK